MKYKYLVCTYVYLHIQTHLFHNINVCFLNHVSEIHIRPGIIIWVDPDIAKRASPCLLYEPFATIFY
jgi:hypothetical protein